MLFLLIQWRRSVVKYEGQGALGRAGFTGTFHFDRSFILDDVKLAVIQQVLNERMCHFRGVSKHTLTPPAYFQGVKTPNPQYLRPFSLSRLIDSKDERPP